MGDTKLIAHLNSSPSRSTTQGHSRNTSDVSEGSVVKQYAQVKVSELPMTELRHAADIDATERARIAADRESEGALNSVGLESGNSSPKSWLGREKKMDLELGMGKEG